MRSLEISAVVTLLAVAGCAGASCPTGTVEMDGRCVADGDGGADAAADGTLPDGAAPDGAGPEGGLPDGALPPDGGTSDAGDSSVDASVMCGEGLADCDGVADNGCEVDLNADDANCGRCDTACGELACAAGTCRDVVEEVVAGWWHVCARTRTGRVFCWGDNTIGQLGDGTMATSSLPVEVPGLTNVVRIAAGGFGFHSTLGTTCALERSGRLFCWGSGGAGQVGDGVGVDRASPVLVSGGVSGGIVDIAVGVTSCARTAAATYCWGEGTLPTPLLESLDPQLRSIHTGSAVRCGVGVDDRGYCWGNNAVGAVGDGTTVGPRGQTAIALSDTLESMGVGSGHACALSTSGQVYCWGGNSGGALGVGGAEADAQATPTPVPGQDHATTLFVDKLTTCSIQDGSLWCWGRDPARWARGDMGLRPGPERVPGVGAPRSLTVAGPTNMCLVTQDYRVLCWGSNAHGELGNGTFEPSDVPVEVMGLP